MRKLKILQIAKTKMRILNLILLFLVTAIVPNIIAQHRGDNLSFQGLSERNDFSAKALAMGSSLTSMHGDLSALYYNPAGLAKIKDLQFSISSNYMYKQWRENQIYRPDRYFVTLPFYLEGLYIPDPANNGKWDYQVFQDTNYNYFVKEPQLGVDPYSKEAADWNNNKNNFGLTNISAALPFQIQDHHFTAAISFHRNNNVYDFDKNDTYLDPHIGYLGYPGDITRVNGIYTMDLRWSRFLRQRFGSLNYITSGIAYQVSEELMVGIGSSIMWGKSNDYQSLIRVGDFLLSNQQRFTFTYKDISSFKTETSKYSSTNFNLSAILDLERVRLGLKIDLPYTLKREWNFTQTRVDSLVIIETSNGTDKFKVPAVYNVGISFQPVDDFTIAFDYEIAPFSKGEYERSAVDSTFNKWKNRNTLRFGIEYKASNFLTLMTGYQNIPQVFIPDGAAIKDKGPDANTYSIGASIILFLGRIDLAYEMRILKYYDSYFSNTNYAFEKSSNFIFGYTYSFK